MAVRPNTVVVLGVPHSIDYYDNPYDVDQSAQYKGSIRVDWTGIRILDRGQPAEAIWQVLWHELLHSLAASLDISALDSPEGEDDIDRLATGINDILIRNHWLDPKFGLGRDDD